VRLLFEHYKCLLGNVTSIDRHRQIADTGPLTRANLQALRFDTAVIGCCGLTAEHGLTAYDLDDADIKRVAIASSRRVIAVTEAAKLSRTPSPSYHRSPPCTHLSPTHPPTTTKSRRSRRPASAY
jgi:hypothetical protein